MLTFANVDGVKTMPGLVPTLSQFTNIVCRVDEKHGVMEDLPDPRTPGKYLPIFHGWAGHKTRTETCAPPVEGAQGLLGKNLFNVAQGLNILLNMPGRHLQAVDRAAAKTKTAGSFGHGLDNGAMAFGFKFPPLPV